MRCFNCGASKLPSQFRYRSRSQERSKDFVGLVLRRKARNANPPTYRCVPPSEGPCPKSKLIFTSSQPITEKSSMLQPNIDCPAISAVSSIQPAVAQPIAKKSSTLQPSIDCPAISSTRLVASSTACSGERQL